MTHPKTLTRIVTCQGGIQLIAALAALSSRESEQKDSGYEYKYEDFLVVYDLCAPHGEGEEFFLFVRKMALAVCNWKAVIYLKPEQLDELAARLDMSSRPTILARVHELVGATKADEIYLCRNWQFGNQLMINAYQGAEKICYGDGIGIYFSEAYFSPAVGNNGMGLKSLVRRNLRHLKNSLRARVSPVAAPEVVNRNSNIAALAEVDFDLGYFLLPDILGEEPPMKTRLVRKELTERILRKLAGALDADHIADRYRYISRVPTVVLMTSNFSEAARMSGEKEIVAYRKFLERLKFPRESTLIVKPHPRDSEEKIQELGRALGHLFSDVVLLTDPNLFFVPFEIFLMQTFRGETEKALRDLKIVTFSTACLSLEVLFNLGPIIGFGNELVSKFFYEDYVRGRIRHEHDLQLALQKLAQVA
ncbi:MAG: polysialyltransferase family glycosyltransferase [Pyrinomonadaceae bacterium]